MKTLPLPNRTWLPTLVFATAFATLIAVAQLPVTSQTPIKLGTVDMQKVFEGYYKKKQADAQLAESMADADKVIKGWEDDYQKANAEYRKLVEGANDQAVSADEREKRKKLAQAKLLEIQDIQKSYTQFKTERATVIEEQKKRMMERLLQRIREVIATKAKAGLYTMVFDTGTRFDVSPLLYTTGQNDLTDEVLAELNADAPPGALTSDAKTEKLSTPLPKPVEPEQKPAPPPAKPGKSNKKP